MKTELAYTIAAAANATSENPMLIAEGTSIENGKEFPSETMAFKDAEDFCQQSTSYIKELIEREIIEQESIKYLRVKIIIECEDPERDTE